MENQAVSHAAADIDKQVRGYMVVFGTLLALTVVTVGVSYMHLTIKDGRGRVRAEEELELDPATFDRLWPLTDGRRIVKTRYEIPAGNDLTIELDVYHGPLAGLATAEVEFGSVEDSERFNPPHWFGREVTEADEYKNRALAIDGLP